LTVKGQWKATGTWERNLPPSLPGRTVTSVRNKTPRSSLLPPSPGNGVKRDGNSTVHAQTHTHTQCK
jgi:hypothetical protein